MVEEQKTSYWYEEDSIVCEEERLDAVKHVRFIDKYLCEGIHNPVFWTALLMVSAVFILVPQYMALSRKNFWDFLFVNEYIGDLFQQTVNVLFIARFIFGAFGGVALEFLLFLLCNVGCLILLFSQEYSLLYTNIHLFLKLFILWQISYPYVMLFINMFSYAHSKMHLRYSREQTTDDTIRIPANYRYFLIESNNNFLPIFIAHSFFYINLNHCFIDNQTLISIYRFSNYLVKFYCIYQYILYEVVNIVHGIEFCSDYKMLYLTRDNGISINPSHGYQIAKKLCLLASTGLCISLDLLFIASFYI